MLDPETMQLGMVALAAVAIGALAFTFGYPYFSGDRQIEKRRSRVTESRNDRKARVVQVEETNNRKQAVADTLKELEERQRSKEEGDAAGPKLLRAGLDVSTNMFWVASAITGVVVRRHRLLLDADDAADRIRGRAPSSAPSVCRAGSSVS